MKKNNILLYLMLIILAPFFSSMLGFLAMFHPSVQESTDASLGECNIYYKNNYIPCLTKLEAFEINYKFGLTLYIVLISFILMQRLKYEK